jgi:hypothetical protein
VELEGPEPPETSHRIWQLPELIVAEVEAAQSGKFPDRWR